MNLNGNVRFTITPQKIELKFMEGCFVEVAPVTLYERMLSGQTSEMGEGQTEVRIVVDYQSYPIRGDYKEFRFLTTDEKVDTAKAKEKFYEIIAQYCKDFKQIVSMGALKKLFFSLINIDNEIELENKILDEIIFSSEDDPLKTKKEIRRLSKEIKPHRDKIEALKIKKDNLLKQIYDLKGQDREVFLRALKGKIDLVYKRIINRMNMSASEFFDRLLETVSQESETDQECQ